MIFDYDPQRWNWQDTVAMLLAWIGLPCFLFGMKWKLDARWRKLRESEVELERVEMEKFFAHRERISPDEAIQMRRR
jgi:hypothetical protein